MTRTQVNGRGSGVRTSDSRTASARPASVRRAARRAILPALFRAVLAGLAASPAAAQSTGEPARSPYPGSLPFFHDIYTFRGDAGRTLVVAAFAVSAGELTPRRHGRRSLYRFDVSLVLADTALRTVSRSDDSVFVAARRSLPGRHLLYTHATVLAPPSRNTVRRVIMTDANNPGVGQLYDAGFPIPDYSGDSLMLSDIALGQPDPEGGWSRGDAIVAILPVTRFPDSSLEVYYEIYNLPTGHRYETRIAVQRDHDDGADPAALRFTGRSDFAPDRALPQLRRVTGSLDPGRYRLTVTVTDSETGAAATRSRLFEVREWEDGATLVVARPSS